MVDMEQYYPTPPEVARKLFSMIDHRAISNGINILEPSAGTGELIEELVKYRKSLYRGDSDFHGHCIEINPQRAATLKGKGYKVVWEDFLTFDPLMRYTLIIMNPPFREGAKHLMKALKVCDAGGQIACILNAETLRNPCTDERKALITELEQQEEYKVEYVTAAFTEAERKTNVEVALVYVLMKQPPDVCVTFECYKEQIFDRRKREQKTIGAVARYGELNALVDLYSAEVKAALKIYEEIIKFNRVTLQNEDTYDNKVFKIEIERVADEDRNENRVNIIRKINYKYWKHILYSKALSGLMTNAIQQEYMRNLSRMADYEFNDRNILAMKEDLTRNIIHNIEVAIMDVWEEFTHRYSWVEYSKNIHYYNGWHTNKAFACNKKVIIPLDAFNTYSGRFEPTRSSSVAGKLSDIEKVMNYLDCGRTEDFEMYQKLEAAQSVGINRGIDTKFFSVDLFKKGTCHLTFKDLNLLKKFNLYCGRKKNWLPDDYGRKHYSDLNEEEKGIVDSFEGKASYEDTFTNQDYYLPSINGLLMLTGGRSNEAGSYE